MIVDLSNLKQYFCNYYPQGFILGEFEEILFFRYFQV